MSDCEHVLWQVLPSAFGTLAYQNSTVQIDIRCVRCLWTGTIGITPPYWDELIVAKTQVEN